MKSNKLVILAGGFSTRLGSLGNFVSKSLLPIFDTSLLSRQVKHAIEFKLFDEIIISTNPLLFPVFESHIKHEFNGGEKVKVVNNEFHKQGSLQALLHILEDLDSELFTISLADIYFVENPFLNLKKFLENNDDYLMGTSKIFNSVELKKGGIVYIQNNRINLIKEKSDPENIDGMRWNGIAVAPTKEKNSLREFLVDKIVETPEGDYFQYLINQGNEIKAVLMPDFINNNSKNYLFVSSMLQSSEVIASIDESKAKELKEIASYLREYFLNQ